ncbi:MAG: MBL fold metallo-hydrolase [Stenomitos rutilans HA7619-LM2]|jgi:L-ascorbate metabolism protein UlaG (beta-lactamase superfamily)|nr:MBL fold metallo-hydrolase [Stenomitos rutilans HA7619-LM2]
MRLTRIDLNSWLFHLSGYTILVDPWLVDPLVFYGQPWLYTAYHNTPIAYTPETLPLIDLILLSQGVDDHCHKPTLERLDRSIPVVASPTAAKVVQQLGYQQITAIARWEDFTLGDTLKITAIPGAELQPGQIENGYLLRDITANETLYYEPHLFPTKVPVERFGSVDVAIAPVIGQVMPLLGQVIMGPLQAMHLVETLKPRFFLPTALGDVRAEGILPKIIQTVGSVEEFRDRLLASGVPTQLRVPAPGETVELTAIVL